MTSLSKDNMKTFAIAQKCFKIAQEEVRKIWKEKANKTVNTFFAKMPVKKY